MTWSKWFVTPALTSVFFLLGVLTLYWFMTSKLIKYLEKRHDHVNTTRIQTILGVSYMMLLIISTQLTVEGTSNGWVFVNFQVFAVIFVSYFLELNIRPWQLGLLILIYMGFNGTLDIGMPTSGAILAIIRWSTSSSQLRCGQSLNSDLN